MKTIIYSTLSQFLLIAFVLGSIVLIKVGLDPVAISFFAISTLWNLLGLALFNYFYYWCMIYLIYKFSNNQKRVVLAGTIVYGIFFALLFILMDEQNDKNLFGIKISFFVHSIIQMGFYLILSFISSFFFIREKL